MLDKMMGLQLLNDFQEKESMSISSELLDDDMKKSLN